MHWSHSSLFTADQWVKLSLPCEMRTLACRQCSVHAGTLLKRSGKHATTLLLCSSNVSCSCLSVASVKAYLCVWPSGGGPQDPSSQPWRHGTCEHVQHSMHAFVDICHSMHGCNASVCMCNKVCTCTAVQPCQQPMLPGDLATSLAA